LFLCGKYTLDVPVYTVWGACEDVRVLEKFRSNEYKINNLHIIDEASSRLLDVGGVKLRLLGLGGAVVMHKLFDNGEGRTTIAGGQGTMWTTLLQMGELVDTAHRVYDPAETRIFITHNSPARDGLLNQLSVTLKADFSISAGLHFRYGSSYNEFSVNPSLDHYRGKLASSKASFNDVWETVKGEVAPAVQANPAQQQLLDNALQFVDKMPTSANGGNPFGGPAAPGAGHVDESAFKNMWNFNLADAAFGWLVLEVEGGRIGTEMKAQGFNFSHRGGKQHHLQPAQQPQNPATVAPPVGPSAQTATPTSVSPAVPAIPLGPRNKAPQPQSVQKPASPVAAPSPKPEPAVPSKPATPQPAPTDPVNKALATAELSPQDAPKTANGAAAPAAPNAESPTPTGPSASTPTTPFQENAPVRTRSGFHISGAASVEAVRELFPEDDRKHIINVEEKKSKQYKKIYHIATVENDILAKEILSRLPSELTSYQQRHEIYVKFLDTYDERRPGANRGGMDSSKWRSNLPMGGNTSESDNAGGSNYNRRGGGYGRGRASGGFDGSRGGRGTTRGSRGGRLDGGASTEGGNTGAGAPAQNG
jgi:hypothetical protein